MARVISFMLATGFLAGCATHQPRSEQVTQELDRREIEAAVLVADEEAETTTEPEPKERGPSQSELLVRLAFEHYRIGVDDRGEAFAVRKNGPNVALMFKGLRDALRSSLSKLFRRMFPPNDTTW